MFFACAYTRPCESLQSLPWFNSENACINREEIKIIVVSHGIRTSAFWGVVREGALHAGKDLGVNVVYRSPEFFDLQVMKGLVEDAIKEDPDGLVVRWGIHSKFKLIY